MMGDDDLDFLVHPFECLPGSDLCTICGRPSFEGPGPILHGFCNDIGEVDRTPRDAEAIRQYYTRQPGVDYGQASWSRVQAEHMAALGDNPLAIRWRERTARRRAGRG